MAILNYLKLNSHSPAINANFAMGVRSSFYSMSAIASANNGVVVTKSCNAGSMSTMSTSLTSCFQSNLLRPSVYNNAKNFTSSKEFLLRGLRVRFSADKPGKFPNAGQWSRNSSAFINPMYVGSRRKSKISNVGHTIANKEAPAVFGSRFGCDFLLNSTSAFNAAPRCFSTMFPNSIVGAPAPLFVADAVFPSLGSDLQPVSSIKKLDLQTYFPDKYVCLFFWPFDFSFVCPSEILAFDRAVKDFESRNVQLIGVSIDSVYTHQAWKSRPIAEGGIGSVQFPLVSDVDKKISSMYGVLSNVAGFALRAVFLIDKQGIVRHQLINDAALGRSVDETIRIVDALQFTEEHGELCPANWSKGKRGMKATMEETTEYLRDSYS